MDPPQPTNETVPPPEANNDDPNVIIAEQHEYIKELRDYMYYQDDRILSLETTLADSGKANIALQNELMAVRNVAAPAAVPQETEVIPASKIDWTYEHVRTLIYWMNIANINIFLLDASVQYYKKVIMRVMAVTFLFSTLSTTVSLSQLGISETAAPDLSAAIKYIFMAASAISTLLVGYIKLFKLQEMMDADAEMHKDWLDFATKISGELQMPTKLRKPALALLQDMKSMYIGLFCKQPFISTAVKLYANRYFASCDTRYDENEVAENKKGCFSRTNYIKRTNVFFVFQDIMKNEIKRLATEIEIGNLRVNRNDTRYMDDDEGLPTGSVFGAPRLPESSDLYPNVQLDYAYEGPFIVIRVITTDAASSPKGRAATGRVPALFAKRGRSQVPDHNFSSPERALYLQKASVVAAPQVVIPVAAPQMSPAVHIPPAQVAATSSVKHPTPVPVASRHRVPKTAELSKEPNQRETALVLSSEPNPTRGTKGASPEPENAPATLSNKFTEHSNKFPRSLLRMMLRNNPGLLTPMYAINDLVEVLPPKGYPARIVHVHVSDKGITYDLDREDIDGLERNIEESRIRLVATIPDSVKYKRGEHVKAKYKGKGPYKTCEILEIDANHGQPGGPVYCVRFIDDDVSHDKNEYAVHEDIMQSIVGSHPITELGI